MKAWPTRRIRDLAELITKGTTPTSVGFDFIPSGINFVKVESITPNGLFIQSKLAHINAACHTALKRSQLKKGDILFSIAGALGRTAIVTEEILPANTNQALAIVRLKEDKEIWMEYVFKALQTGIVFEQIEKVKGGVAQLNLSLAQVGDFQIPVPPLPEQERIVGILDEAFDGIAKAKALAEANLQNARALFQSHLQSVFSQKGKGWVEKRLGDVCSIARGGSPRPIQKYITAEPSGINWVKIGDATASGKYIFNTQQKIIPEGVKRSRLVKDGDFLLSNSMSFGRPYIMKTTGCIHDGWLVLTDYSASLDQDYLYYILGSNLIYQQFDRLAAGSTVRNLNIDLASKVVIPIPSLKVQKNIVDKVEYIDEETQRLESLYQNKLNVLDELKKSLLHQAFTGNL